MARPQFTRYEELIIAYVRNPESSSILSFDLAHLIPITALLILDCVAPHSLFPIMALSLLLFFRVWEWREQRRGRPAWKSIIEKYEAAVSETDSSST